MKKKDIIKLVDKQIESQKKLIEESKEDGTYAYHMEQELQELYERWIELNS